MVTPDNVQNVRQIEIEDQDQKPAYWDNLAIETERQHSLSNLYFCKILYYLQKNEGYKELGFGTLSSYVYERFNRSGSWARKMPRLYERYVIELKQEFVDLEKIGYGKLDIMVAHVTEENIDEVMEDLPTMKQTDIREKLDVQEETVIEENEQGIEEPTIYKNYKVRGTEETIGIIDSTARLAKDSLQKMTMYETASEIPNARALEHICQAYITFADDDGNPAVDLQRSIKSLEAMYGIDITYKDKEELTVTNVEQ